MSALATLVTASAEHLARLGLADVRASTTPDRRTVVTPTVSTVSGRLSWDNRPSWDNWSRH
jgi:hypothetical protein